LEGGTARNVFRSDLDLLSVEIDANYVCATEKEKTDADQIEPLMAPKGYAVRREPSEHAGDKWSYRYSSALGGARTIESESNYPLRDPPLRCGSQRQSDPNARRMCRFSTATRSCRVGDAARDLLCSM